MKSKLQLLIPLTTLFLLVSLGNSFGQPGGPAQAAPGNRVPNHPPSGVPNPPAYAGGGIPNPPGYGGGLPMTVPYPPTPPAIDPTTGLPIPVEQQQWVDESCDPGIVLTNVSYEDLPLSEIVRDLNQHFKGEVDFLPLPQWGSQDWRNTQLTLRLRNVRASQIFNAMNLVFENDRTPIRWEFRRNGDRPTALLRVLPEGAPQSMFGMPTGPEPVRRIYFVGDLTDEKSGGMTMEQIVKTITEIWGMTDNTGGNIQFHKGAQLLVVTGTPGQMDFMEQTLTALRQKLNMQRRSQSKPAETTSKSDESRSGAPAGLR